jgi:membrane protease subunit (stomatin/prohibitin family)
MGLILAAAGAAGSTLRDQWKEYFYVDAIPADTICVKAHKKTRGFSSNHGDDNIITDKSVMAIADGQCMVIVEQGQVVDICAQPGEYVYDSKTEASLFTGDFGDSVKKVFQEVGRRVTFGGQSSQDQRVYYFNTKEIPGLKYGTPASVPFRVVDRRAGIDIDISVKAFGEYSIHLTDPILFYTNVCANVEDSYQVSDIEGQLRTELLTALQPAFAKISAQGIRYSEVPAHTTELCSALNEELSKKWKDQRGIEIVSFGMSSIKADDEDEKMIKQMQRDAAYTDQGLAAAAMVGAQTQAMKDAANNANGAGMGFVGMNAAQAAGGINVSQLYANGEAQKASSAETWKCPKCGVENSGKFCSNCGTPKPENGSWTCPKCGTVSTGKFCSNCGEKKPE